MLAETHAFAWFPPSDQRLDSVPGDSIEWQCVFALGSSMIECEHNPAPLRHEPGTFFT